MSHISQVECKKNIYIECPDGFSNQLRLMLAGVFLCFEKFIDTYNVNWVLNNHNNVPFLDYFHPLPKINLNQIDFTKINKNNIVSTSSFQSVIQTLTKKVDNQYWQNALQFSLNHLIAQHHIQTLINNFIERNNIKNCLGVHIRRTCKSALLRDDCNRVKDNLRSNEDYLNICNEHDYIYLATDNMETQKWFKDKLKSKLIVFEEIKSGNEKFKGKYDRDLVQRYTTPLNTVADFLILKECNTFLGTSESSFSLLIKYWRNNTQDYFISGKI